MVRSSAESRNVEDRSRSSRLEREALRRGREKKKKLCKSVSKRELARKRALELTFSRSEAPWDLKMELSGATVDIGQQQGE